MFRQPLPGKVRGARPQTGKLAPMLLPFRGINAQAPFAQMSREYGISLVNVLAESYGLRTRRGYTEYATNIPGIVPVKTMLSYLPGSAAASTYSAVGPTLTEITGRFFASKPSLLGPPPGKLFAAKGGFLYSVGAGGIGPWVAEPIVTGTSDYWTQTNFQNVAGTFLCITNDNGGYAIYNGAVWAVPTMGGGAGQIANVDPATFCFVFAWKKRLWFIQKDTSKAWYLPVGQITGAATEFDFGEQFKHGGALAALSSWTVDGGDGLDDKLVAVSYEGDVVLYSGIDPSSATDFQKVGSWYVGPLPVGRRAVTPDGGEVHILSQFGLTPLSKLISQESLEAEAQQHISYLIDPIITWLMQQFSNYNGWQVLPLPKEELIIIGLPPEATAGIPSYLAYKVTQKGWSVIQSTGYISFVNIGPLIYAGTLDGRVVRAFDGPVDNILLGAVEGTAISCQVTPSYQPLGTEGLQKIISLVRPSFLCRVTPSLRVTVLPDYGTPKQVTLPTLPNVSESLWHTAAWNAAVWSGILSPIREWLGCSGLGFAATVQLDYVAGGDTVLTNIDFWVEQGGPL